jgi:hypothetical protein
MADTIKVGDRVQVFLNTQIWKTEGWFNGTVVRIDPYSKHRSFYWVELDPDLTEPQGRGRPLLSVLNPKNIRKL